MHLLSGKSGKYKSIILLFLTVLLFSLLYLLITIFTYISDSIVIPYQTPICKNSNMRDMIYRFIVKNMISTWPEIIRLIMMNNRIFYLSPFRLNKILNNKTPNFTVSGVKLGVCFVINWLSVLFTERGNVYPFLAAWYISFINLWN